MDFKFVAFDMDGTLVEEPSSWRLVHQKFGTEEEERENVKAWEEGEIDYEEFMRRDVELWRPKPNLSQLEKILSEVDLKPKVPEVVFKINEKNYHTAIVSGALDILAEKVAARLGIAHVLANGLEADEEGVLTGEGIFRVDPIRKEEALENHLGVDLEKCVCVGNEKYDASFLEKAGLGVAVGEDNVLMEAADVVIEDFENFETLLDYL